MYLNTECRTTSGKPRRAAFTLMEILIAMVIALLAVTSLMVFFYFSSCSFASMSNYADLDRQSQVALDNFTKQVRQTIQLTSYTTTNSLINGLTFLDYDSNALTFSYNPGTGILTRTKSGASQAFLTNCNSLQFQIFQRNLQSGTFDAVTTATATNCKLVQANWTCSKNILGSPANSESVQSAKVVIRE
jgi:Tfp pilus assembly protein PilW